MAPLYAKLVNTYLVLGDKARRNPNKFADLAHKNPADVNKIALGKYQCNEGSTKIEDNDLRCLIEYRLPKLEAIYLCNFDNYQGHNKIGREGARWLSRGNWP